MGDDIDLCRTQVGASIMRTALEAIQELHHPAITLKGWDADGKEITEWVCKYCTSIADKGTYFAFPCSTRRLADQGLGGGQDE